MRDRHSIAAIVVIVLDDANQKIDVGTWRMEVVE